MTREEICELDRQIAQWNKKREDNANWLQTHHIDHPQFEQRFRDQNNVIHKINQLEARKKPVNSEYAETYSIPPRQPRNRF